jgi:hydrogenase nickel incorporation protein HypB
MTGTPRILEVRRNILKQNDELARRMRVRFREAGTFVVDLVSSPGSGKTALLERTLAELRKTCRPAALVGDLATDNDAVRLARSGVPVRQITTGTLCHLEAHMVETTLAEWDLSQIDILFIENVGNLVCPSAWDLGEDLRVVLMSVTEGEDKPLKYPTIFNSADAAVITKADLAEAVEFNRPAAMANMHSIRPGMPILEVSTKTGKGFADWINFVNAKREQPTASC